MSDDKMVLSDRQKAIAQLREAYQEVFAGPAADLVMKDLARFCRAHVSTFDPNSNISAFQEGRREVFLRIQENLELSDQDLWRLKLV